VGGKWGYPKTSCRLALLLFGMPVIFGAMSTGLPWQNNSWDVAARVAVAAQRQRRNAKGRLAATENPDSASFAGYVTVTNPVQLPDALAQREKPIIIENVPANKTLIRWLTLFLRYGHWWVLGGLLAYAINQNYGIQLSKTIWHGDTTTEYKIILTPHEKP
jgi:hypothetical protein